MYLPPFEYLLPGTWREALRLKAEHGSEAAVLAGGTDIVPAMQNEENPPKYILSLRKLVPELRFIRANEGWTQIGCLTTHDDLDVSPLVREEHTVLAEGASLVGSPQIRHAGTIGGNLCSALPSADTSSPLIALGGELLLSSVSGERRIPAGEFFKGPGKSELRDDELLHSAFIPSKPPRCGSAYIKFGRRNAMEIAVAGASAFVTLDLSGETCERARIALTSSGPIPWRCIEAEKSLAGERPVKSALRAAAEKASAEARPRDSFRSTEAYRRRLIVTLTERALDAAFCRAREELKAEQGE